MLVLFFYIVLSICNLFYTTPQALSFKSYRLSFKDMYVCMYSVIDVIEYCLSQNSVYTQNNSCLKHNLTPLIIQFQSLLSYGLPPLVSYKQATIG